MKKKFYSKVIASVLALSLACPNTLVSAEIFSDSITENIEIESEQEVEQVVEDDIEIEIDLEKPEEIMVDMAGISSEMLIEEEDVKEEQTQRSITEFFTDSEIPEIVLFSDSSETFTTIEDAAIYLRQKMVERQNYINICVDVGGYSNTNDILTDIEAKALECTTNSYEGDYLKYNIQSVGYDASEESGIYNLSFSYTYRTTYEQEEKVSKAVASIVDSLRFDEDTTDYVKVKKIYDYICQNISYDYENLNNNDNIIKFTAYGAVVNKTAVCHGISLLMYKMLLEAGLSSRMITGTSREQNHSWNLVQLNGLYYNLDATWDLGMLNYDYFLKCDGNFNKDHYRDSYYREDLFYEQYPIDLYDYVIQESDYGKVYNVELNNVVYKIQAGEAIVEGYTGNPVDVVIPHEVEGNPVVTISKSAFAECKSIKSIHLPVTIINIEDATIEREGAFYKCEKLEKVSFDENAKLKVVGRNAFFHCLSLSDIRLPNSVERIGLSAFQGCSSLMDFVLPSSLTVLEANSLLHTSIKKIHFPANLGEGFNIFSIQDLDTLEEITVSEENKMYVAEKGILYESKMYSETTRDFWSLKVYPQNKKDTKYVMPELMSTFDGHEIQNPYLETIVFNELIRSFDFGMLNCSYYEVDPKNITFDAVNGVLYSADGLKLISIPTKMMGHVAIEDGTREILQGAAKGCKFSSIELPKTINKIGDHAFSQCEFSSIELPEAIGEIGEFAFAYNTQLRTVVMPHRMERIGQFAFEDCRMLRNITIPEGITTIELNTFRGCPDLMNGNVVIPEGVISIEYGAFLGCICETIIIPDSVVYIDGAAFNSIYIYKNVFEKSDVFVTHGKKIIKYIGTNEEVTIPEGIEVIGGEAFREKTNIKRVIIPNTVKQIGERAFLGCENLEYVFVPKSVTKMGMSIFQNCPKLITAGKVGGGYNIEFEWDQMIPDRAFYSSSLEHAVIPEGITNIGKGAFFWSTNLKNIIIPKSVAKIGYNPFGGTPWYENLVGDYVIEGSVLLKYNGHGGNVIVPDGITEIREEVFKNYKTITSVHLPESLLYIGDSAFEGCEFLEQINIPEGVAYIGDVAFAECTSLKQINIPESVTYIGVRSFWHCLKLTEVVIPQNVKEIEENSFGECYNLKKITLNEGLEKIDALAFSNAPIEELVFPNSLIEIGKAAFHTSRIRSLRIPGNVKRIGDSAFSSNTLLENVIIEEGVCSIGGNVFEYGVSLKHVVLPKSLTDISRNSFRYCPLLTSVGPISSGKAIEFSWEEYIPENAFSGNSYLTEVVLPEACKTIGARAFYYCTSLEKVDFLDGISVIGNHAFAKCFNLTEIELPITLRRIGANCFRGSTNIVSLSYNGSIEDWNEVLVGINNEWTDDLLFKTVHIWNESEIINEPTCEKKGLKILVCQTCSVIKEVESPALGHSFTSYELDGNVTCLKDGTRTAKCDRCEAIDTIVDEGSAAGHEWSKWKTTTAATVLRTGLQKRSCGTCGEEESQKINKLPASIKVTSTSFKMKTKQVLTNFKVTMGTGDYVKSFVSNRSNVVTVTKWNKNGTCTLTAKAAGTARLTIVLASGKKAYVTVVVSSKDVATTKISGVKSATTVAVGKYITLTPVRSPFNSSQKVTYKTSNAKIAKVSSTGKVVGVAPGRTIVTVTSGSKYIRCAVTVPGIVVNTKATVLKGKTTQIKPVKYGISNAFTFTSSNTNIVRAAQNGTIKGMAPGVAKVTIQASSYKAVCTVTVPGIRGVSSKLTLTKGKTTTLKPVKYGISGTFQYTTSNKNIVNVSSKGVIKAVSPGIAKITIQAGSYKAVCTVTVPGIKGVNTTATLARGKTLRLKPVKYGIAGGFTYKSSNISVATVSSSGVITAKKAGTTVITVACGSYYVRCKVTVK